MGAELVTVLVENSYACRRESSEVVQVPAPAEGADLDDWWNGTVNDHTGDGHPCGSTEHALYEVRITEAPDRPDLIGETYSWEG